MIERLVEKILFSTAFEKLFRGVYPRGYVHIVPLKEEWDVERVWDLCEALVEQGNAAGFEPLAFVDQDARVMVIYPDVPRCAEFLASSWMN